MLDKTELVTRLTDEKFKLNCKRIDLHKFIMSKDFDNIASDEQRLLKDQYVAMTMYYDALNKRLELHGPV